MSFKRARDLVNKIREIEGLKPPLLAILFAHDYRMQKKIVHGTKAITIRTGWRNYKAGQRVILSCPESSFSVWATITEVRHTTLEGIELSELFDDGFSSQKDLFEGMKKYYPDLKMIDKVTVIRWDNVEGLFVDNPDWLKDIHRSLGNYK